MQKLVNRNPVLRFKLGNKIIKADNGIVLNILGHKTEIGPTASKVLRKMKRAYNYYKVNSGATEDFGLLYGRTGDPITFIRNVIDGNVIDPNLKSNEKIIPKNDKNSKKDSTTITKYSTLVTKPRFLSKYSNMESTIGGANNIKTWLQKLKNYYAPGTYNPDSIWGANTQAAYDRYLADQAKLSVKFTVPSITESTQNESSELNRRAKPITVNPTTTLLNEFALDKQTNYPSMSRSTAQELFDKVILRDEFKTPYNPNFNWKNAPKLSYYPKLNYYYAKQGVKLIPRKKIKFLASGPVTTLKTGGNILKFQGGTNSSWKKDWSKETPVGLELTNKVIESVRTVTKPIEEHTAKASKRNSRVAGLLLELWNKGFFKGVIDKRTGKQVTYERAVDGYTGRMTSEATEKAKKAGYNVDKLGLIKKNTKTPLVIKGIKSNNKNNLGEIRRIINAAKTGGFGFNSYYTLPEDSKESNLKAIFEHKIKYNVNDPYGVIDKKNQTLNIYKKDLLIKSYPITKGLNKGDGMAPLSAKYLSQSPRTTGAGVFTIESEETSPYMEHEPLFRLIPDSIGTLTQAIHSPSGPGRILAIKNKTGSTYGCVNGFCGTAKEIYEKLLLNDKDSVYVLPEIEGNNMIERNGKLSMDWGPNNPKTYIDSKGNVQYFRYNNKR